jgi:hypothetical protein
VLRGGGNKVLKASRRRTGSGGRVRLEEREEEANAFGMVFSAGTARGKRGGRGLRSKGREKGLRRRLEGEENGRVTSRLEV